MRAILFLLLLPAMLVGAAELPITLTECLGYAWGSDLVHRTIEPAQGQFFADRVSLVTDGNAAPMQLDNVVTYPDGSLRRADLWFRSDLPANGSRTFVLRAMARKVTAPPTDLTVTKDGNTLILGNALTAVRIPAGEWTSLAPGNATLAQYLGTSVPDNMLPGPVLGVKLASGKWTTISAINPAGAKLTSCVGAVLVQGPIFMRARVTYGFDNGGSYSTDIMLRNGEPLIRVDERYEKAGAVAIDIGTNLHPSQYMTEIDFRGTMTKAPIAYDGTKKLTTLVSWDNYYPERAPVVGYLGVADGDLLAWMSTENSVMEWLPEPYRQQLSVTAEAGGTLHVDGSLEKGRRTWAWFVGKSDDFPNDGRDLYRWWTKHLIIPLDKVANWQLEWPGMDAIVFPHTFFSNDELPEIRARLRAEPVIAAYMEDLRKSGGDAWGWSQVSSRMKSDPDAAKLLTAYRDKYRPRGGIAKGPSYLSAAAIYFDDRVYLEQLAEKSTPSLA